MEELVIKETSNYSIFKKLEGNRDLKSVNKIIESIERVGYVINPIIVNENYEVIDGQNRLDALSKLNMPVHYFVVDGIGINEARSLNLGQSNWSTIDFVKSYAASGNESYLMLVSLMDEFKGLISLQEIYGIISGKILINGVPFYKIVCDGTFKMSKYQYESAKTVIPEVLKVKQSLDSIPGYGRLKITALGWVFNSGNCDNDRLVRVINEKYPIIRPAVLVDSFLSDLSNIYNVGLKSKNRRYFNTAYKEYVAKRREK